MVRATLLAPFDGVVTRRLREPGDTVALGHGAAHRRHRAVST
jgi:multidrug resistance efflux pump